MTTLLQIAKKIEIREKEQPAPGALAAPKCGIYLFR